MVITGAFSKCSGLKTVTLSNSLTKISAYMFYESGLTHIEIPENITTIEENAFDSCSNLKSIIIPDSVVSIDESAFRNIKDKVTIYGNNDSTAQKYAQENGIKFDLIENYGKGGGAQQPGTGGQTQQPGTSTKDPTNLEEDPTTAKGILPNTGKTIGISIAVTIILGLGAFGYIQYRRLS